MNLTPNYIKNNLNKIGIEEAYSLLKEWVTNSNDLNLRLESLRLFGTIESSKNFKFFEQLFLSDENIEIRISCGKILKDKYLKHKKIIPLLEFTLSNVNNFEQKFLAVEILNIINTTKTRKIIKNFLKKYIKTKLRDKKEEFPKEIFSSDFDIPIPQTILEICFNVILYDYYVNECRCNVTLRDGFIILLNFEGSNLNRIKNMDALNKLTHLEHLLVQRNNIKKIDGLENLENLKKLDLSKNNINCIENLQSLNNLEELDLSYNNINDIENLNSLKNLKKLNLESNSINNIDGLQDLNNLEELNLSHNRISEIKNLESLGELKKLNLSFNQIERISGLKKMENLIWLYLNNNNISQIEGLDSLHSLRGLYLSNNVINRIENIENLINLSQLALSNNKIQKIEGLTNQLKLNTLYLDDNSINKLEGIKNLKNLNQLYLVNNQISKYSNKDVENLEKLYYIFLNGNPLTPESWLCYKKKMTRFP
jgi:Leucine-rich repeat (LRR) protein